MKRPSKYWKDKAEAALSGKLGACSNCGSKESAYESIIKIPKDLGGGASTGEGTPGVFFLRVRCSGCALVRLFDAEALDLIVNA